MASCTFWDTITSPTRRPRRWRRASATSSPASGFVIPMRTMASQVTDDAGPADETEREGPLDAVLGALGLRRKPKAEAPHDERPGSELVGQAEAFQRLTVADVMIPRADIVALEIGTPLEDVAAQ